MQEEGNNEDPKNQWNGKYRMLKKNNKLKAGSLKSLIDIFPVRHQWKKRKKHQEWKNIIRVSRNIEKMWWDIQQLDIYLKIWIRTNSSKKPAK